MDQNSPVVRLLFFVFLFFVGVGLIKFAFGLAIGLLKFAFPLLVVYLVWRYFFASSKS